MIYFILLAAISYQLSGVDAVDCYYCGHGNISDIIQLSNIYGKSELAYENGQYTRTYSEDCLSAPKKSLKTIKCPYGCMFAEYVNTKAVIAGCARDGLLLQSFSTLVIRDEHFEMSVCNFDECNESSESAKANNSKYSTLANFVTSTVVPQLEINGTDSNTNSTQVNDTPKGSTLPPKRKPNSSASIGVSVGALFVGLAVYFIQLF